LRIAEKSALPGALRVLAGRGGAAGVMDRCSVVGGNFLESVPGSAETDLLKWIVHDRDYEHATIILRNCRRSRASST
jgi:hypothetical protein